MGEWTGFMTNDNNNWSVTGITNDDYKNFIGMYNYNGAVADTTKYYFMHSFVPASGLLTTAGEDISVLYQMGDENSDWEGVRIGGIDGGYTTN